MEAYLEPKVRAFLRYLDFPGSDPVVVYLAGLGLASTAVFPRVVIEPGLFGRRSILVDLFGSGYSDISEDFGYTLEEHASTLSGLLDHIGSKKYVLVGHSMGGAVAIELASMRPDVVVQLILAEANLDAGGGMLSSSIAAQTEGDFIRGGYREMIDRFRNAGLAGDYVGSVAAGIWQAASPRAMHRGAVSLVRGTQPVMRDKLMKLPIPRTFIFGGRTLEEYEEDRQLRVQLEFNGIQVGVVPNAGHPMQTENPAGVAQAINEALVKNGV